MAADPAEAPPDGPEPPSPASAPGASVSAPIPLIGVALGLLAAAGVLRGTGSTAGSPHFPIWLLLLGMGVIVLGGALAVVVLAGPTEGEGSPRPLEEFHPPSRPDPVAAADAARRASLPEPPRPGSGWTGGGGETDVASRSGAEAPPSLRATVAARVVAAPTGARSTRLSTPSAEPATNPATAEPTSGLACATCQRPLPTGAGWRRCRQCGRSLCVKCLTESVRKFGSGYCSTCAPRSA